eukprot:Em0013g690a
MYVGLLCAVLVSVFARGQSNGVCYMAVVETSTISVSVVVSSTQYYSCGFWGLYTCSRIEYSTQQVYTTISQSRSQFACCDGYLQIGTSESCKANITSGPAIPQLSTVVVNTTGNPNSLHAIWSLTNNSNGSSPSFNASCTAQDGSHHVDYSVGQTYNATFVGLRPSTSYTCCVWAVVAGNAGSTTCAVLTQTQGLCDGFSNSSSCLNGSTCLKYYYNTTVMNCLCQMCPIEYVATQASSAVVAASDRGDSWAAPLVAILATVIVVMVTVAVILLVAHLVRRKAHQRSSMRGQTKANPTPSFELFNANTDKNGTECDAAPLDESEYMYATTPECTWDKHAPLPNTASANTSQSNSELCTKVGKSLQHKHTDSSKDEGSGDAATESDYSKLDHSQDVAESPDSYNTLAHHATKDHMQAVAESPDKYDRATHHAANNQSDEVYSALNEGGEKDLKLVEGYGILRGPLLRKNVNSNTSHDVYSSLLDSNVPVQPSSINNPVYLSS